MKTRAKTFLMAAMLFAGAVFLVLSCGPGVFFDPASRHVAPTVSSVSPTSGTRGVAFTVNGDGFLPGASVSLGGSPCLNVNVVSVTQLTCNPGLHGGGPVDVVVTNSDTQSGRLVGGFTYQLYLYVGNLAAQTINSYSLNSSTGALSPIGAAAPFGNSLRGIKIDPFGHFLYVCGEGSSSNIKFFSIDPTNGALSQVGSIGGFSSPRRMAFTPNGQYMYVANAGTGQISALGVNPATGILSFLGNVSAGSQPHEVAVTANGQFLYAADNVGNTVYSFQIDPKSGLPVQIGSALPVGNAPNGIALDPAGRYLYVSNNNPGVPAMSSVSGFSIDPGTGALTALGSTNTTGGSQGMAFHPFLNFLFLVHGSPGSISEFLFDPGHGIIASAGEFPDAGADTRTIVDPSGTYLYVAAAHPTNTVTIFQIDPSGALTAAGSAVTGDGPDSIDIE